MKRQVGLLGTVIRIILGAVLFGGVFYAHFIKGPFRPLPWVIGLLIFPGLFTIAQYLWARHHPGRLDATGPIPSILNVVVFFALFLTFLYAPAIAFMSNAVSVFYGLSMFVAALRGYGGCEVLAISNWLLHRDDQIGCLLFSPVDAAEARIAGPSHR